MYNFLLIVQYISIIFLLLEAGYIFSKMKTRLHGFLFFNCVATLVNNLGYLYEMTSTSEEHYLAGLQMSYLGRCFIPFSLFIFMLNVCKVKIDRRVEIGLGIAHGLVFLCVLTCKWHNLYYYNMRYVKGELFPYIVKSNGIVHWIYDAIIIFYITYGMYKLVATIRKETDKISRRRLATVTIAILIESLCFILNLILYTANYDLTVMGYAVGTIFMYVAIFRYGLINTPDLVKEYIIDEVSEGIIAVNTFGEIEYFNQTATKIFPRIATQPASIVDALKKSVEADKPLEIDDKVYGVELQSMIYKEQNRGKIYVVIDDTMHYKYLREMTEQKEIAEKANASKSAFLSVVSHEIRTPMNAVVGMTDLLLRDGDNFTDKQEKYLKNIKNSGAALVMIVNDILDQSKIEAGKMEIIEAAYELRPMLEDVKLIIENRIGSKPIELKCEVDNEVPKFLVGDSLRIRQILINLMNNAVKFSEEGYIKLAITCVDSDNNRKKLRFSVEDSGQGIKPEDLDKLGKAFSQVNTAVNHNIEGTGLGLSISRDFISMMGGALKINSEYGVGTEFYFSIWQSVADGIAESSDVINKQAWQEDMHFTAPDARVLLVDDTVINLMIAKELLSPIKLAVDTAKSGDEAIEMVKNNHYDIIFMDYMMPQMNGVEATQIIRSLDYDWASTIPVVALTGDASDETKAKFTEAGINDFTEKPVTLKHLKSILIKWLPREMIVGEEMEG